MEGEGQRCWFKTLESEIRDGIKGSGLRRQGTTGDGMKEDIGIALRRQGMAGWRGQGIR